MFFPKLGCAGLPSVVSIDIANAYPGAFYVWQSHGLRSQRPLRAAGVRNTSRHHARHAPRPTCAPRQFARCPRRPARMQVGSCTPPKREKRRESPGSAGIGKVLKRWHLTGAPNGTPDMAAADDSRSPFQEPFVNDCEVFETDSQSLEIVSPCRRGYVAITRWR